MSNSFLTHMFWADGNLSNIERMSVNSFLRNGHQLCIWTYGHGSVVPPGATLMDAREILPESMFFTLPNGSCGPFSDLFRYAVLNKIGGMWADTDIIALSPLSEMNDLSSPFLVTERHRSPLIKKVIKENILGRTSAQIVGNMIYNPTPAAGSIVDLAYNYSERFPKDKIKWAEIGPNLLDAIEKIYPDHGYKIMPPEFANPFGYWTCPEVFLRPGVRLHKKTSFVHLYNQRWREAKIDKNAQFPKASLMSYFAERYL